VVWIPKGRRRILIPGVRKYLEKVIFGLIEDRYPDVYVSELSIQPDHIHALIEIPPKYAVSTIIGYLKGRSSLGLRKKFEFIRKNLSTWSPGYFVSSVGVNEALIKKYIKFQQDQDWGQTEFV
jgi:putative transposase